MLSRSAQGLYWTGRHLERAAHICRLLTHQFDAIEDRSVREVGMRWRRLYASLGRKPTSDWLEHGDEDDAYMLTDAYTLADDLTFEATNPDSVRNCIANARENLRQVRNAVSREMWGSLNQGYLTLQTDRIENIWDNQIRDFYQRTENAIRTFMGTTDSTMYRDEGWSFLQLGRFVERSQLVTVLLDSQLKLYPTAELDGEADWDSLLAICLARGAYRRLHSFNYEPDHVIDFMVTDAQLPYSLRNSLRQVQKQLAIVTGPQALPGAEAARQRVGRLVARLDFDWPAPAERTDKKVRRILRDIRLACRHLHVDIDGAFFHYAIEDTPTL